jgi:hypothetical protein
VIWQAARRTWHAGLHNTSGRKCSVHWDLSGAETERFGAKTGDFRVKKLNAFVQKRGDFRAQELNALVQKRGEFSVETECFGVKHARIQTGHTALSVIKVIERAKRKDLRNLRRKKPLNLYVC